MKNQDIRELFRTLSTQFLETSGGQELRIVCPNCRNPKQKCYVQTASGLFHCFHCGSGGSWVHLAKLLGSPEIAFSPSAVDDSINQIDPPPFDNEDIEEIHNNLTLGTGKQVVDDYLLKRRGYTMDTINKFRLGWDGKNLVVPVLNAKGECLNLLLKRDPTLPTAPSGIYSVRGWGRQRLFNESALLSDSDTIIICEGIWDCMMLDQQGYLAVTSTAGAMSFSQDWIEAFRKFKSIYLCYDTDEAGKNGSQKVADLFQRNGIIVKNINLPSIPGEKVDVTDYFVKLSKTKSEFDRLLENARSSRSRQENITVAEQLVNLTLELNVELFLDELGEPHVTLPEKPLVGFPLHGSAFRRWISGIYWQKTQKGIGVDHLNQAVCTLEGQAFHQAKSQTLHNRVGRIDDQIFYDLGDDKNIVEITGSGWKVTETSPIKFRRFKHQIPQVIPLEGGSLEEVLEFVNLEGEDNKLLILTYLVAVLVPDIPRAILIPTGDQGSAKSSALRVIRSLVDPSLSPLMNPPTDMNELGQMANHHYCLYLDNLSSLRDDLSDALCRLATGIGFSKRKLYSDDEDILFNQMVAIGLSGINLVAQKPDLLDRSLILNFHCISDDERREEKEFWPAFEARKPYIMGGLFSTLSNVLGLLPEIKLHRKPRLADYSRYAATAAVVLGETPNKFLETFDKNVGRQNRAAIDSSPTAQVILAMMQGKEEWSGSSSALYTLLKGKAEEFGLQIGGVNGFPKGSNWLWRKIMEVRPNLLALGVSAGQFETAENSTIKLTRARTEKDAASAAIEESEGKS